MQLGLHTGFRVSEYAQASTKSIKMAPRSNPPRPAAICQRDLRSLDQHQRLRWLRDAYETYLRNTVIAAEKHAKAVLEALESFDT